MQTPIRFPDGLRPNMSRQERYLRVLAGAFLLIVAFVAPFPWAWVGLYPLLTGACGISPIYRLLDIDRLRTGD